jgi:predicted transcriptional regulator
VTRCDQILWLCVHRTPKTVSEVAKRLDLAQSYIWRRFELLRDKGLMHEGTKPTQAGIEYITNLERHLRAAGLWVDVPGG